MEDTDRRIVELLAADGRMSFTDLGRMTGLSTSAVHQRVRRLERNRVIRGYRAVIDPEALGLPLMAIVAADALDPADTDKTPDLLSQVPGIESCYSVAGSDAFILIVRVASAGALEVLLAEIRSVARVSTRTSLVLSIPFEDRFVP